MIRPVLVLPADAPRERWLAARRQGIGGSDLPAILGLSPYRTPLHVYHNKRGELPDDDGGHESARWGQLVEDVIAREWARQNGVTVRRRGLLARADAPWQMVSLDRVVVGCAGPRRAACLLEIKMRGVYSAGSFRTDVPDDVLAQVQWGLHVSGLDHGHVAALIGGNRMVEHRVERDSDVIALLVREATDMWVRIHEGNPPTVEPGQLLADLLDRLFPNREGSVDLAGEKAAEARAAAAAYRAALAAEAEAERRKAAARARLALLLGGAEEARVDGRTAWTYRAETRAHVDVQALREDHPAAFAACVTTRPTRPVLRLRPGWTEGIDEAPGAPEQEAS